MAGLFEHGAFHPAVLPCVGQVYWEGNAKWFKGMISAYNMGKLDVVYDEDGMKEEVLPGSAAMWVCTRFVWARTKGGVLWPCMVRSTLLLVS